MKFFVFYFLFMDQGISTETKFKFFQNDYNIIPERMELVKYDKKYIREASIRTFKYNRTLPVTNATLLFNVDIENRLMVRSQAYKFLSNEYRYFPLRLQVNVCDAFSNNLVGLQNTFNCGNFSGCPFRKNVQYFICNFYIDARMFPPLLPTGKYMVEHECIFNEKVIIVIRGFGIVERSLPYD